MYLVGSQHAAPHHTLPEACLLLLCSLNVEKTLTAPIRQYREKKKKKEKVIYPKFLPGITTET